jgi:hypothetical protein
VTGRVGVRDVGLISRSCLHVIEWHFDPEKMTALQLYRWSGGSMIAVAISVRKPTDG